MQSIVTFEMILFACQLERFYELYMRIYAAVAAFQESECRRLGITDYEQECIIKYEMMIFTIRRRSSGTLVWHAAVERRPIQPVKGFIKLTVSTKEGIDAILKEIEDRTAEFGSVLLKMEHSEESSGGIY